ncbi:hypothetical protein [Pseudoxanthomonas mexicana]
MSKSQKAVAALGLLLAVIAMVWAPFNAHYKRNKINLVVDAGYGLVFQPPSSEVCRYVVARYADAHLSDARAEACTIGLDGKRQITALGVVFASTAAICLLLGLVGGRPQS